jgi:hypothetical protein
VSDLPAVEERSDQKMKKSIIGMMLKKAIPLAAASILAALSTPVANAEESDCDGVYFPHSGQTAHIPSHIRTNLSGNGGDVSAPTGTLTNADGCVITIYVYASPNWRPGELEGNMDTGMGGFIRGEATSGAGPTCQTTPRMKIEENRDKVLGGFDLNIVDIDNNHSWFFSKCAH